MTEELEKKAEEYQTGRKDLNYFSEPYKDKIRKAYIAGAKENQPTVEEMLKRLLKEGYVKSGIRDNKEDVFFLARFTKKSKRLAS